MPAVRKLHAARVQGLTQRAQAGSTRPSSKAATAKEKATEKPTYPRYSMGGWKASPGSWSRGLRPWPSAAAGIIRSKGFDVNRMNKRKPMEISPCTPSARARKVDGRWRPKAATEAPKSVRMNTHRTMEPS